MKFAEPFWRGSDHLLLYNVDILSDIDLGGLIGHHVETGAEATLAVRDRSTQRYLLFDREQHRLCGWRNVKTGEKRSVRDAENPEQLAFSGIHVLKADFARMIPSVEKSSMTQFYLDMADRHQILSYPHDGDTWQDVGKFEEFHNLLS